MQAYLKIIDYLNANIWVRLAPTSNGVGVVAIRDIPIGTKITDYDENFYNGSLSIKYFIVETNIFLREFQKLHPSIQGLMKDRYIYDCSGKFYITSPNCHQFIRMYINHSENPNIDKNLISIRNISEGDEITFSYKNLMPKNLSDISKKHFHYVL